MMRQTLVRIVRGVRVEASGHGLLKQALAGARIDWLRGVVFGVRTRLTLWYAALLALMLVVFGGIIYSTEQQYWLSQFDTRLRTRLEQLAGSYSDPAGRMTAAPDAEMQQGSEIALLLTPQGRIMQLQASGRVESKVPWATVLEDLHAAALRPSPWAVEEGLMVSVPAGTTKGGMAAYQLRPGIFRITGMPIRGHGQIVAQLYVGMIFDVPKQLAALVRTLAIAAPLFLLFSTAGGYWLATRALRPVKAITRAAQQISETDLRQRLHLRRRDELGALGATLDRMLDRLEAAFIRQRQFTADASHELRTPLTIVDLEATRALAQQRTPEEYRRAIAIMQQENGYMARLVNDLLTLARADGERTVLEWQEVDLGEIVLDVAERLAPLLQHAGLTLSIGPLEELCVQGDAVYLKQVVTNVIENAVKHSAGIGTQIRVDAEGRCRSGSAGVWLAVTDDGPGIAAEHLPHLFERFYRVEAARTHSLDSAQLDCAGSMHRSGSGLGLAITHWIVQAHGGEIWVQSEVGHGASFAIWLPAHGSPARWVTASRCAEAASSPGSSARS